MHLYTANLAFLCIKIIVCISRQHSAPRMRLSGRLRSLGDGSDADMVAHVLVGQVCWSRIRIGVINILPVCGFFVFVASVLPPASGRRLSLFP